MKLPIYAKNIEIVQLAAPSSPIENPYQTLPPSRGFEIYVDDVLVAYGPVITYYPEGNR